jgi:hypothetical protein
MPRDYRASENQKRAKTRRMGALARNELREASAPRESPVGATSFPVKKIDMATSAAIDAFLARRGDTGDRS